MTPSNTTPPRKHASSECSQLIDPATTELGKLKFGKVRRILAMLEKGRSEKSIAANENISEGEVRAVRCAYFAIVQRAVAIVRLEHENTRSLIAELECDVLDEEVA